MSAVCSIPHCKRQPRDGFKQCLECRTKRRGYMRTYYEKHRERLNSAPRDPEKQKSGILRRTYGIDLAEYRRLLARQCGLCAICRKPETSMGNNGQIKSLSVDHCHESNRIRALLCNNCNRALGLLKDSEQVLQWAINYLAVHSRAAGLST